jgi:hypothetical protein
MMQVPAQGGTIDAPSNDRPRRLAVLNDTFRRTFIGGRVVVTPGVAALGSEGAMAILRKVATFDAFTLNNDPHGEHDFGSLTHEGTTYFWKIDAYDRACEFGSPDPLDPAVTCRVLTVLRADEY